MKEKYQKSLSLTDFPFHHMIQTRWKDMDSFGHVNNAAFLTYFEDARIVFFERWKINTESRSLIVASVKMDYHKQLYHPSEMVIGQKISRIGNTSFDIDSSLFIKTEAAPFATVTITCVCYDFILNKSVPVYVEIKEDYKKILPI